MAFLEAWKADGTGETPIRLALIPFGNEVGSHVSRNTCQAGTNFKPAILLTTSI